MFPKAPLILSKATYDLVIREGKINSEKIYKVADKSVNVNSVEARAYSTEHIVGSLQFLIEGEAVYTGDFYLERARLQGKNMGLRKKVDRRKFEYYFGKGLHLTDIAKLMDVSYSTLRRRVREWNK